MLRIDTREGLPAINVKDYGQWDIPTTEAIEALPGEEVERIYDECVERFWHDAKLMAVELFGWENIGSAGRMGGWLTISGVDPDDEQIEGYAVKLEELMDEYRDLFVQEVRWEVRQRERAKRNNELSAAVWRD